MSESDLAFIKSFCDRFVPVKVELDSAKGKHSKGAGHLEVDVGDAGAKRCVVRRPVAAFYVRGGGRGGVIRD